MDQSLIRENTREIKEKYVHIIQKEFETSNTIYDKILALKTMANAGIDLSVYELEKIIIDMKEELPPLLVQIVGSMEREPNQQVMGFSQQNIEPLVNRIVSKLYKMEKDSTVVRGRRLARKMNIRVRESDSKKPYAMIYFRYKDMDYAVVPVDEKIAAFFYETSRKIPTTLGIPVAITSKIPTVFSAQGHLSLEKISSGFRVKVQAQPSLATTHISQMRLWTPLFEQGVKILHSLEMQIPVDVKIDVEQRTLLRFSTQPVAFFRFPHENKNEYAEAEEKTITLPQWEKMSRDVMKSYTLAGMNMIVRGNWMNEWNIENVLLGEYLYEIVVEPTKNTPKEYSARLVVEQIESGRIDKPQFENLFEKKFETEESEYDHNNEGERRANFHKMVRDIELSQGYNHRMTLKLEAIGSEIERYAQMELRTSCNRDIQYCKLVVDVRRSPLDNENREWTFNSALQLVLPETPRTIKELKNQKHREVQGLVGTKWGGEEKNEMIVKMQVEQNNEQKKWLQHAEKELRGIPAYELLIKAARLNQIKAVVEYKLTPSTRTSVQRIFDIIKGYTFWYSQIEKVSNKKHHIFAQLTIDPISRRFLNMIVETPEERLVVQNLRIPRIILPSIARKALRESISEKAVCDVKSTKISTFDNLLYRAPITNCYSVIAKDCSEEPQFAVLVKKTNKSSEEKVG
uniref:VWFD domain-containing protein n=1 Tax=Heterorhabditis bacteriophora TaxID=37862 RepID=A0A1I7WHR8_HETBA